METNGSILHDTAVRSLLYDLLPWERSQVRDRGMEPSGETYLLPSECAGSHYNSTAISQWYKDGD